MNQDFTVKKKQYLSEKKFVQRGSTEKKIPAQAVSEKKNSCELVRSIVLHFLIMYLLTLLVEDLVRLLYLRTSDRTEEFTLTRPCVNLKNKVRSKSSCQ